ncbi:MAG: 16S rRNA (guanine(527)-N(7))-methyltransferase RsmG [Bacteroidales bacterium]|nr:16S rRNA (guanine(527)-N(7))-methyltransferase RsmG [Bacteroidales bacterium]MBQ9475056.1 16S rRNA (guanine(527)-N(7))-methyltransferase RsmG [Bacteroidales bacterium]
MRVTETGFAKALELYREWNARINVVSRKDIDNLYEHHVLHSLAIARYLELHYPAGVLDGARVLDLGTGGGFPGIPLAMEYPEAEFVLCDSVGKKLTVAAAVAEGLGLKNVEFVNARAESLPGCFDWVVTRAVAPLGKLYPWVAGRLKRSIVALKGGDVLSEISEMCRICRVPGANVRVWSIEDWLKEEYFKEKFVIEVGKSYLCPPDSE